MKKNPGRASKTAGTTRHDLLRTNAEARLPPPLRLALVRRPPHHGGQGGSRRRPQHPRRLPHRECPDLGHALHAPADSVGPAQAHGHELQRHLRERKGDCALQDRRRATRLDHHLPRGLCRRARRRVWRRGPGLHRVRRSAAAGGGGGVARPRDGPRPRAGAPGRQAAPPAGLLPLRGAGPRAPEAAAVRLRIGRAGAAGRAPAEGEPAADALRGPTRPDPDRPRHAGDASRRLDLLPPAPRGDRRSARLLALAPRAARAGGGGGLLRALPPAEERAARRSLPRPRRRGRRPLRPPPRPGRAGGAGQPAHLARRKGAAGGGGGEGGRGGAARAPLARPLLVRPLPPHRRRPSRGD